LIRIGGMTNPQSITPRKHRRRGQRVAAACTIIAVSALAPGLPAEAATVPTPSQVRLSLPEPTGRYQVGAVAMHLIDHSRPDPWQADKTYRELMITVYYPATRAGGHSPAPYMLPGAAAHFDAVATNEYLGLNLPTGQVDWAATVTHAVQGAPVADRTGPRPVLIYSPGLGEPRTWDTTLVEDLASRGYLVVTIDNTYESPEVQFPNGSVATPTMPGDPDAFIRKSLAVRVSDTSFVLDQLALPNTGQNPDADGKRLPDGLTGSLNLTKVGMFGHSSGGTTAAAAMDGDPRITAGLNMDGDLTWLDGSLMPVAERGLDRPFLLLGKDGRTDTGPGWQAFLANTPGWAGELTLRGSQHASFTDAEALLPQMGLSSAVQTQDIGTIDPAEAIRTEEAYVSAFFDHWLRGRHNPLLDGPSPVYPAMEFPSWPRVAG
jgi:predicted dienelactone hydrolase